MLELLKNFRVLVQLAGNRSRIPLILLQHIAEVVIRQVDFFRCLAVRGITSQIYQGERSNVASTLYVQLYEQMCFIWLRPLTTEVATLLTDLVYQPEELLLFK